MDAFLCDVDIFYRLQDRLVPPYARDDCLWYSDQYKKIIHKTICAYITDGS